MTGKHLCTLICSLCAQEAAANLLLNVNSYTFLQTTFTCKWLWTLCAGVGFSTSVNSIMFQQTKLINKQLSTFEAAGGFFPSVKSHMCYQWFFTRKRFDDSFSKYFVHKALNTGCRIKFFPSVNFKLNCKWDK